MANTKIPSELVAINAISGTLIADNAITSVHIAENNITATQIAINAVTALQMADGTITSAKIADGTIVTADIADGQITTGKIADSSVTQAKIGSGAVVAGSIASGTITSTQMAGNSVSTANVQDNAINLDKMAGITRGSIIYGNAAGNPAYLAAGTNGHVLTSDGTDISWTADTDLFLASSGGTISGSVNIGSYQGSVVNSPLDIKSDSNHFAISIEENSGTETWQLGVNADGDLNFYDSGATTPIVTFSDSNNIGIGEVDPDNKLDVNFSITGEGSQEGGIKIHNVRGVNNDIAPLYFGVHGGTRRTKAAIGLKREGSYGIGPLIFALDSNGDDANVTFANDEKMRIETSGNVGIGTGSNVDEMLHIEKSSGTTLVKTEVAANSIVGFEIQKTGSTTSNWRIVDGQTVNGNLEIYDVTDSRQVMVFDGDGDIGMGVTPATHAKLTLGGTATSYSSVLAFDNNTTGGASFFMLASDNSWNAGGNKFFMGHGSPSSSAVDVTIDSDGNVGIGETAPLGKLHVRDGSAQAGISHTYIYDASSISIEATEPSVQLMAEDSGTHGGSLLWRYGNNAFAAIANPTTDAIDFTYGVTTNNDFQVHSGTNMSSYLKIMSIGADGNVVIGNSTYGSSLGQLRVINDAASAPASLSLFGYNNISDDAEFAKIDFASQISGTGGNPTAKIAANIEGTNERAAHLTFHTHNDGGSLQERMRIDSDGHVGIGVSNPGQTLEIHNSNASDYTDFGLRGTGHKYVIGVGNASVSTVNDKWYLYDNDNTAFRMVVDTSGKLLIGDTASHTDDLLQIETPASGGGHGIQIRRNDSNNDQGIGHIQFGNNTDTDLAKIAAATDGSTDNARLSFWTQADGGSLTERMRIAHDGHFMFNTAANAGFKYFIINQVNDGALIFRYNNTDKWQQSLDSSTYDKMFYSYTAGRHVMKMHADGRDFDFTSDTANDYTPRINLYSKSSGAYCGEINFYSKHNSNEWVAASIFATGGSGYGTGNPPSGGMRLYVRGAYGDTHAINAIEIASNGVASGDFNDTSDVSLKKDIVSLNASDSLTAIKALNPVSFKWKLNDEARSGFIAQEVETHLPNDVIGEDWRAEVKGEEGNPSSRDEGSKGKAVNSTGILAHAVKVIQEQQKEIDALKARVSTLEG